MFAERSPGPRGPRALGAVPRRRGAALGVLALLAGTPRPASAEVPALEGPGTVTFTATAAREVTVVGLTTGERVEDEPTPNPLLLVLRAPEFATELAFAPLIPVVLLFEKLRLHERLFDLITNDERTLAVAPIFDFTNRSGLSGGFAVIRNDPLGSPDRAVLVGILRENLDRSVSFSVTRRLPFSSGRRAHFGAGYGLDQDARYFGLGGNSRAEDEHALSVESFDLGLWLELPAPIEWSARIEGGLRRRRLRPGTGEEPPLSLESSIEPPPGFGEGLTYPETRLLFEYDSRDSNSRPSRGFVASLSGLATRDLEGRDTGALVASGHVGVFLPVLPLSRNLVLTLGGAAAFPFPGTREVPYHALVSLGGGRRLRGYPSDRFQDRFGWWATAEYRYKVFEYGSSGNGLSASVFADTGQVGREVQAFFDAPLRWSVGFGFRAEMNLFFLARLQLAWSPEGPRVVVAVNEIL